MPRNLWNLLVYPVSVDHRDFGFAKIVLAPSSLVMMVILS